MPVSGQIWPFLGNKTIFLGMDGVKLLVPSNQESNDTFFVLKTLIGEAPIAGLAARTLENNLLQNFGC